MLNEVLARNDSTLSPWAECSDWVELANTTASPVSLAGMSVSDSAGGAGQWVFPAGATLPANGFLRVWCDGGRVTSIAVSAEFEKPVSVAAARAVLAAAEGIDILDEPAEAKYPLPLNVAGSDNCQVGRLRMDCALDNGLAFWVVGDQLLKGAALNAVQIAELI